MHGNAGFEGYLRGDVHLPMRGFDQARIVVSLWEQSDLMRFVCGRHGENDTTRGVVKALDTINWF